MTPDTVTPADQPPVSRRTSFTVTYNGQGPDSGRAYRWHFWRDRRAPAAWMLETHDGTRRTLESTWTDSVPRILEIAANYGMTPPAIS